MRRGFVLIALLAVSLSLLGQKKYPTIEKLSFSAYYNWGFIWVKAGVVDFSLSKSELYPNAHKLMAVGHSLPSWDWIFAVRDTLVTHYNPKTFLPYAFSRSAHEGNYHKTYDYKFYYKDSVVIGEQHRIGRYRKTDTVKLLPRTYDMLSVAWFTRELDFEKYEKNDLIPIRIMIDEKIYDLYIRYLGVNSTKIKNKKEDCYVFSPLLIEGNVFKGGENMKIWVSKDEYRLPLLVEAKILVGSVKAIIEPELSVVRKDSKR